MVSFATAVCMPGCHGCCSLLSVHAASCIALLGSRSLASDMHPSQLCRGPVTATRTTQGMAVFRRHVVHDQPLRCLLS